jgi:hypothetical protein
MLMMHIQEDAGEAIESGGFLAMARPWRYSRKLKAALLAEFVGMAIFQIYGGNSPDSGEHVTCLEMKYHRRRDAEGTNVRRRTIKLTSTDQCCILLRSGGIWQWYHPGAHCTCFLPSLGTAEILRGP